MKRLQAAYRSRGTPREVRPISILAPSLVPHYLDQSTHRSSHSHGQPHLLATVDNGDRARKGPLTPKVQLSSRRSPRSTPRAGLRVVPAHPKKLSPRGDLKAPLRPTPPRLIAPPRSSSTHRRAISLPSPSHTPKTSHLQITSHKAPTMLKRIEYTPPVKCFGHSSHVGYSPSNPGKVNQDNFIEVAGFSAHPTAYLFGVCDGHGTYGKEVSMYAKQRLPVLLGLDPTLAATPKNSLTHCIMQVNAELMNSSLDVAFSGSTLVVVFVLGNTLWCANVGDSRALLARLPRDPATSTPGQHWTCLPLSRDHKPDTEDEARRITSCGGRIASYQDHQRTQAGDRRRRALQDDLGNPLGPARVWLRDHDIPGLAMSRSIGDYVASTAGVICVPEIMQVTLEPEAKFLVIGSDGVFEFLSNEEVVEIVAPFWAKQDVVGACSSLDAEARARWTQEEEVIDDITCVVVFLEVA